MSNLAFINFHDSIASALDWLDPKDGLRLSLTRRADNATPHVIDALRHANRMQDKRRAALCLRVLNWLRAAREKEGR